MVSNEDVAEQFDELADRMLLIDSSWFKVSAYRRAAKTLRELEEPVEEIAARGQLKKLPGVGDAIRDKIEAYLATGHIPLLERLRHGRGSGLLPVMRETGLTARSVRALAAGEMQIDSLERLREELVNGELEASGAIDEEEMQKIRQWAGVTSG